MAGRQSSVFRSVASAFVLSTFGNYQTLGPPKSKSLSNPYSRKLSIDLLLLLFMKSIGSRICKMSFTFHQSSPPVVLCDNIITTYICANPVFRSRMKHVATDFNFVCQQVQQKALEVRHLHSTDQVIDDLTKPLLLIAFLRHFHTLGSFLSPSTCRSILMSNICYTSVQKSVISFLFSSFLLIQYIQSVV